MPADDFAIDLGAYFRRIGYAGPREPTLETLKSINLLHPQAIAFETLDPFMGRPVDLDSSSLERKLVHDGRGGYCYEHNLLFGNVLEALGFEIKNLAARTVWGRPMDSIGTLTHTLMLVALEGISYVVDVGFSVATLTAPLRLEANIEQPTPHETCRLVEAGAEYVVQVRIKDEWISLYRFDLQERYFCDYEVGNWFTSTHPNARFVTELMAARADSDCRHALRNNSYVIHYLTGESKRHTLDSVAELRATLENAFLINLPDTEDLDRTLERIVHQSG